MAYQAVLFDLDGTLLDTNTLHIEAWRRAFAQFGHKISPQQIAPQIGRTGKELMAALLDEAAVAKRGDEIQDAVEKFVPKITEERRPLRVLEGAPELFDALRKRNLKIAIATSAGKTELKALISGSGFDVCELADVVTTKDDAENSKPEPDILCAACDKLHIPTSEALFVGDTKWDAISGQKAGVISIGVLECSAFSAEDLLEAGMRQVFPSLAALLENLDTILAEGTHVSRA